MRWKADIQTKHPYEAHYLKLDCSKAKSKLGWYPKWNIETALNITVDWYKAYQQKRYVPSNDRANSCLFCHGR